MDTQYSIVSTSGLHYRDCKSVYEAFREVRGYSERFLVQGTMPNGQVTWFDRSGYVLGGTTTDILARALAS